MPTHDSSTASPFFTIGHARMTVAELVAHLQVAQVTHLVDVRSFPRSRTNPQFNIDTLPDALAPLGVSYQHMTDLGGRRNLQRDIASDVNGWWENRSFHNYADYALHPTFAAALAQLRERGHRQRLAFMCAESVWWRCHRRIITDWLLAAGEDVQHIMADRIEPAHLSEGASVDDQGQVTYPAKQTSLPF